MNNDVKRQNSEDFVAEGCALAYQKPDTVNLPASNLNKRPLHAKKPSINDIINQFLNIGVKEVLVFDGKDAAVFKEKIN